MQVEVVCGKNLPARVSKAEPKYRRDQRKAGPCIRTVFENGVPVSKEEVVPAAPQQQPKAAKPAAAAKEVRELSSAVWVNGVAYRSTRVAFRELGLPDNKHVKFRAQLKRDGANTFIHNGQSFAFEARIPTTGSAA